jgi:hypothetical protein
MELSQAFYDYALALGVLRVKIEETLRELSMKVVVRENAWPRSAKLRNRALFLPEDQACLVQFLEALLAAQKAGAKIEAVTKTLVGVGFNGEWFYLGIDQYTNENTVELFAEWWNTQVENNV